jgi:NitT/TauT family transport system substrate-binding protein
MPVQLALRNIQKSYFSEQGSVVDPKIVNAAVKRMLDDGVYPRNVDIAPKSLTVAMDTQIALGNLKQQPKYNTFIAQNFIHQALAAK